MAKSRNDEIEYSVACCNISENGIKGLEAFIGTKVEVIAWINMMQVKHYDLTGESFTLFNLDFDKNKEVDLNEFFSLEELSEGGIIKLS